MVYVIFFKKGFVCFFSIGLLYNFVFIKGFNSVHALFYHLPFLLIVALVTQPVIIPIFIVAWANRVDVNMGEKNMIAMNDLLVMTRSTFVLTWFLFSTLILSIAYYLKGI